MADRPSIVQLLEIGVEGTAGTEANPTRLLRGLDFTLQPQAEFSEQTAQGFKSLTTVSPNREWTTWSYSGDPDFNELPYLLSSLLDDVSPTTAGTAAGGTSYDWTYEPTSDDLDAFQTYTFRYGDSNIGEKVTGNIVNSFTLDVTRADVGISGDILGGRVAGTVPVSGTAAFHHVGARPVLPTHFDIYLDTTSGNLGSTKLTRDFQFQWAVSNRHTPVWPINSALDSYAVTTENMLDQTITIQVMADAVGSDDFLQMMRNSTTKFLRAEAVGGTLTGGTSLSYTFRADFALVVTGPPSVQEVEGLEVWQWQLKPIHDAGWGKSMSILLRNELSAL